MLLPYAIKNPGVTVDELSLRLGVDRAALIEDLELVFMCGLPGYGPGDLIDVTFDDDRVYVSMADYFGAPLRLTPAEALALYAGGSTLVDLPGMEEAGALRRALDKLAGALGSGDGEVKVALEEGGDRHLETIKKALADGARIRMDYFSASRGQAAERMVDPWGVVVAFGRWYLVGFDHMTSEERMFRSDRIQSMTLVDEPAEVPEDLDLERYRTAFVERGDQPVMTFEISPRAQRWFHEYYPVRTSERLEDGWERLQLSYSRPRWAATVLLVLGEDARSAQPQEVVEEARELATSIAARHSS